MSLVLDSSAASSLMLHDEKTPASVLLLQRIDQQGATVPTIWRIEVANALLLAERRGRVTQLDVQESLGDLAALQITEDDETSRHAWLRTIEIARRSGLTRYDAIYVELAQRLGLPLVSLDVAMNKAAVTLGIQLA